MTRSLPVLLLCSCAESLAYDRGAQMVFTAEYGCPANRVTVIARPDTLPHSVLRTRREAMPVAAGSQGTNDADDVDRDWHTYEVRGCGEQLLYACQHPTVNTFSADDGHTEGDLSFAIQVDDPLNVSPDITRTVWSAVRCLSSERRRINPGGGSQGDIRARGDSPDLLTLPPHSAAPVLPPSLRHLRGLFKERPFPGANRASCEALGATLASQLGWEYVAVASQPHDIVVQSDCYNVSAVTRNDQKWWFLPINRRGRRFEAPDGTLIDEIAPPPATISCTLNDEQQCATALREYVLANLVDEMAKSTKLLDYAARLARQTGDP
jgi:hypothetical protein